MAVGMDQPRPAAGGPVRLGLRENWPQFALLVVVNMFVGGMVGLERATTSLVGTRVSPVRLPGGVQLHYRVRRHQGADQPGGRPAHRPAYPQELVAGWAVGLPVPFLLAWAPAWVWIVAANVCLGVNQGLTSSMVVNMKIDLVGPRGRGLAMGLNEAAGYMVVGGTALATGYLAAAYGLRPVPELVGATYAAAGLLAQSFGLSAAVIAGGALTLPPGCLRPGGSPATSRMTAWACRRRVAPVGQHAAAVQTASDAVRRGRSYWLCTVHDDDRLVSYHPGVMALG